MLPINKNKTNELTYNNYGPLPTSEEVKLTLLVLLSLILLAGIFFNILATIWIVKGKTKRARYIAVCHPMFHYKLKGKRTRLTCVITIIATWLAGLLISIKDIFDNRLSLSLDDIEDYALYNYSNQLELLSEEIMYVPDLDYYKKHDQLIPGVKALKDGCEVLRFFRECTHTATDERLSTTVLFVLIYIIPQAVLGFCYIRICYCLWIRKKVGLLILHHSNKSTAPPHTVKKKTVIILIVMVTAFGALWLPYWCVKMYETYNTTPLEKPRKFDGLDMAVTLLTYFTLISSPLIYLFMDRDFQKKLKNLCKQHSKDKVVPDGKF
ncbi:hypothetical protein EB796_024000 [Bugula neritina]|uniref:G-protein coupled receptors family 1 profile domain-containing protein n=1 Tax=Bugula neritina TaxID=10212 RepID=A0A7J7IV01_BUGNE|nr:hypothetical protein EB796_024000 [Bugula neritina]